jgi:hypothetical protein
VPWLISILPADTPTSKLCIADTDSVPAETKPSVRRMEMLPVVHTRLPLEAIVRYVPTTEMAQPLPEQDVDPRSDMDGAVLRNVTEAPVAATTLLLCTLRIDPDSTNTDDDEILPYTVSAPSTATCTSPDAQVRSEGECSTS